MTLWSSLGHIRSSSFLHPSVLPVWINHQSEELTMATCGPLYRCYLLKDSHEIQERRGGTTPLPCSHQPLCYFLLPSWIILYTITWTLKLTIDKSYSDYGFEFSPVTPDVQVGANPGNKYYSKPFNLQIHTFVLLCFTFVSQDMYNILDIRDMVRLLSETLGKVRGRRSWGLSKRMICYGLGGSTYKCIVIIFHDLLIHMHFPGNAMIKIK